MLRGVVSSQCKRRNTKTTSRNQNLRASPHLSPLALKAANPLLSPFGAHLELKLKFCDERLVDLDSACGEREECVGEERGKRKMVGGEDGR